MKIVHSCVSEVVGEFVIYARFKVNFEINLWGKILKILLRNFCGFYAKVCVSFFGNFLNRKYMF